MASNGGLVMGGLAGNDLNTLFTLQNNVGTAPDATPAIVQGAQNGGLAFDGYDAGPTYQNNSNAYGGYGSYAAQQQAYQQQQQAAANARADNEYRDSLNAQNARLDTQQNIGLNNLQNSYNSSENRLNDDRGVAERNYTTGKTDTERGYQTTRDNVATTVRNRMSALQRLLGIAGAGNSSAAYEAAPLAALKEGSVNLNGAQTVYATNRRNQDTNWEDTIRHYQQSMEDLRNDLYSKQNSLKASIAQTRAGILDKLAGIGNNRDQYKGQINSLLDQITNLGNQYAAPVLRTGAVAYNAPNLQQYSLRANAPVTATANASAADSVNPILAPLLNDKRDEFGNPIA